MLTSGGGGGLPRFRGGRAAYETLASSSSSHSNLPAVSALSLRNALAGSGGGVPWRALSGGAAAKAFGFDAGNNELSAREKKERHEELQARVAEQKRAAAARKQRAEDKMREEEEARLAARDAQRALQEKQRQLRAEARKQQMERKERERERKENEERQRLESAARRRVRRGYHRDYRFNPTGDGQHPRAPSPNTAEAAAAAHAAGAADARRDLYAALGVRHDADATEVRRAFQKVALANHPDKVQQRSLDPSWHGVSNGSKPSAAVMRATNRAAEEASSRFQIAKHAFDVLGDADKRAAYDRARANLFGPPAPNRASARPPTAPRPSPKPPAARSRPSTSSGAPRPGGVVVDIGEAGKESRLSAKRRKDQQDAATAGAAMAAMARAAPMVPEPLDGGVSRPSTSSSVLRPQMRPGGDNGSQRPSSSYSPRKAFGESFVRPTTAPTKKNRKRNSSPSLRRTLSSPPGLSKDTAVPIFVTAHVLQRGGLRLAAVGTNTFRVRIPPNSCAGDVVTVANECSHPDDAVHVYFVMRLSGAGRPGVVHAATAQSVDSELSMRARLNCKEAYARSSTRSPTKPRRVEVPTLNPSRNPYGIRV